MTLLINSIYISVANFYVLCDLSSSFFGNLVMI